MITYQSNNVKVPHFPRRKMSRWIKSVATQYGKRIGDIAYVFCDDERILEVNRQYLDHDYYTDIITFDYSQGQTLAGDVFVSVDTVSSNASRFGTAFEEELRRIMIHGILHLCGLKDKSDEERANMTRHEDLALALWCED